MSSGITIMATGHPYYGRMAYNLAATIKASNKDCPVAVVYSGNSLDHIPDSGKKVVFDHIIEMPPNGYGCGVKLWAIDYSPFDNTLLIDADNLWTPKKNPAELFSLLNKHDFTAISEGYIDFQTKENSISVNYFMWADIDQMKREFKLTDRLYQMRSEVMWFKKTKKIEAMFQEARDLFFEPRIGVLKFGGVTPDEYCLNVACAVNGIRPHQDKWQPCFWDRMHRQSGRVSAAKLYEDFYMISTGGNTVTTYCTNLYNNLAAAAFQKIGLQFLFNLQPKKRILHLRANL